MQNSQPARHEMGEETDREGEGQGRVKPPSATASTSGAARSRISATTPAPTSTHRVRGGISSGVGKRRPPGITSWRSCTLDWRRWRGIPPPPGAF